MVIYQPKWICGVRNLLKALNKGLKSELLTVDTPWVAKPIQTGCVRP